MGQSDVQEAIIQALSRQRHDFINHLQVIHAWLQLGKTKRALDYIDELAQNPQLISDALEERPSELVKQYVPDGNQRS